MSRYYKITEAIAARKLHCRFDGTGRDGAEWQRCVRQSPFIVLYRITDAANGEDYARKILEIKKRDCLWNRLNPDFSDAQIKRTKWEEIGKIMYEEWDSLKYYLKDDKVQEMIKKWRNVRDYYTKEKKRQEREDSIPSRRLQKRKRLYSYFKLLSFLDNSKNYKSFETESSQEIVYSSDDDTDSLNVNEFAQDETKEEIMEVKEEAPNKSIRESYPQRHLITSCTQANDDSRSTAVRNFLLSLIPDVENLNDQEYMGFRLGVLNLLNNIKFNAASHESWTISTLDNNTS